MMMWKDAPTADSFSSYLRGLNYSEQTVKNYSQVVEKFIESHYNEIVNETTTKDIQEYLSQYGEHPSMTNLTLYGLRCYFSYLEKIMGIIKTNPATNARCAKVVVEEREYHSVDEIKRILDNINGLHQRRDKLIVVLMSVACLRISEVINIDVDDVNLVGGVIYIRGKGKRNRHVYITPQMDKYLRNYLDTRGSVPSNALFPSNDGLGRISQGAIRGFLNKVSRDTGIQINPHKFRHTGATLAYQASRDIIAVQNLLGHENIESTKRYTHVSERDRYNLINNSPVNTIL